MTIPQNFTSQREELLNKELDELHNYMRSNFQSLFAWFTFYCTIVVGAMAWSYSASIREDTKQVVTTLPTLSVALFYTIQTILGLMACRHIKADFNHLRNRILDIQADLTGRNDGPPLQPRAAIPTSMISATGFMMAALASMLPLLWLGFAAIAEHKM